MVRRVSGMRIASKEVREKLSPIQAKLRLKPRVDGESYLGANVVVFNTRCPDTGDSVLQARCGVVRSDSDVPDVSYYALPVPSQLAQVLPTISRVLEALFDGVLRVTMTTPATGNRTLLSLERIPVSAEGKKAMYLSNAFPSAVVTDRLSPEELLSACAPVVAVQSAELIGVGVGVSSGVVSGTVCFTLDDVRACESAVFVSDAPSPEDAEAILASSGIVATFGGPASHASILARTHGIPCLVSAKLNRRLVPGERVTLDSYTGKLFAGHAEMQESPYLTVVSSVVANQTKQVRPFLAGNADTPDGIAKCAKAGIAGIGLLRLEHALHSDPSTLAAFTSALIAESFAPGKVHEAEKSFRASLTKFLGQCLSAAKGLDYVTVRLLDPPAHEFLSAQTIRKACANLGISDDSAGSILHSYQETNPMLGNRGVRLNLLHGGILRAQYVALFDALMKSGYAGQLRVMVPFVSVLGEYLSVVSVMKRYLRQQANSYPDGINERVTFGVMVETPAACLSSELLNSAEFISFGTNDLTQMTLGISRDDTVELLDEYAQSGWLADNPFTVLAAPVVSLMRTALAKLTKEIPISVCGEHATNPKNTETLLGLGCTCISVPPASIPVTVLALERYQDSRHC